MKLSNMKISFILGHFATENYKKTNRIITQFYYLQLQIYEFAYIPQRVLFLNRTLANNDS